MMAMSSEGLLPIPAPKKNPCFKLEFPFPIVSDGFTEPEWEIATGRLLCDRVIVPDDKSIKMLYTRGFFGTGSLTKHAPKICMKKPELNASKNASAAIQTQKSKSQPDASKYGQDDDFIEITEFSDEELCADDENDDGVEIILSDSDHGPPPKKRRTETNVVSMEKENLILTFEEAYFLSYGLGCLVVKDDLDEPIDLERLWITFCELTPSKNFPFLYTAYHHFRSKGWVVRGGIKYGVDYVLYKDGPAFYHATYSVVVKPVHEQNLQSIYNSRTFTWQSLSALNRINTGAGKALLLFYVIKPQLMTEGRMLTPKCISEFRVEEVMLNRWVPSENRERNKLNPPLLC